MFNAKNCLIFQENLGNIAAQYLFPISCYLYGRNANQTSSGNTRRVQGPLTKDINIAEN